MEEKQLARWIYWEGDVYYCGDCIEKRLDVVNKNKEFAKDEDGNIQIDYENGDVCGYMEDYANEDYEVECCICGAPLFSNVDC